MQFPKIDDQLSSVSVIVVNYNAGRLLLDSVGSALTQARQVIVVDNASVDSSLVDLEACFANEGRLLVIRSEKNLGFAAACNLGMEHCAERHFLFLNPDCVLLPNSLAHMVGTLENHPDAGMVGGLLLNPDGVEQGGGRRAMPTPWRSFVRAFGLSRLSDRWPRLFYDFHMHKQSLPELPIEVEAISGALMLVRREAMTQVGAWDEAYFLHCEDLDWCMRFRKQGWNVLFDAKAPAIHIHGACSQSRPIFVEWHKHKGMVRFYRKFFQHQYPGLLMWLVVAGVWLRFSIVAPTKVLNQKKMQERNAAKAALSRETLASSIKDAVDVRTPMNQSVRRVALVGASSMVGSALVVQLVQSGVHVVAYSRKPRSSHPNMLGVEWREMATLNEVKAIDSIQDWIWLAPIKRLPEHLEKLRMAGAKHVVAVSTTSRFTKKDSSSIAEKQFVSEVIAAEERLQTWAAENSTHWTILRPTLIYGFGMDKNVSTIAKFIKRFHFFPTLGKANGLRQPVHASDVAAACAAALVRPQALNQAYNISGSEVLRYREMVGRIFRALSIRPLLIPIPLWLFGLGVGVLRMFPRFRSWSAAMAERMNQDMVFDHDAASRDLDYKPQAFRLVEGDLPLR